MEPTRLWEVCGWFWLFGSWLWWGFGCGVVNDVFVGGFWFFDGLCFVSAVCLCWPQIWVHLYCRLLVSVLGCYRVGMWLDLGGSILGCFRVGSLCITVPLIYYLRGLSFGHSWADYFCFEIESQILISIFWVG